MSTLWLAVVLILPISALVARRLPISRMLMMALAWLAIFAVAIAVVELIQAGNIR